MKLFVGKVKFIVGGIVIALVRNVSVLSIIAFIVVVDLVSRCLFITLGTEKYVEVSPPREYEISAL
jgi:hypothetical protein